MDIKSFLQEKDPLKAFAHWYIKQVIKNNTLVINTLYDNVTSIADCMGVILYRAEPFQVQMFLCKKNQKSPEHTHPDVDSYELYFGGDMSFTKNGKTTRKKPQELPNGKSSAWGWFLRVNSDDLHEAMSGDKHAAFLSIQYWKNKLPTSVERNWAGERFTDNHIIE
jgi:hypothetical protein